MRFLCLILLLMILGCSELDKANGWDYTFNYFEEDSYIYSFDIFLEPDSTLQTKEDIYQYVSNYVSVKKHWHKDSSVWYYFPNREYVSYIELTFDNNIDTDSIKIYLTPYYDNEPVLSQEEFPGGMPITLYPRRYSYTSSQFQFRSAQEDSTGTLLYGQRIILVDGLEHTADSSYKGYTILPIKKSDQEGWLKSYRMDIRFEEGIDGIQ